MPIYSDEYPDENNPFVEVNGEIRSAYLPPHGLDTQISHMENLGSYGQAAVQIVAHASKGHAYWTKEQYLHASDGTIVAKGLGQAAQIIKELEWSNGSYIAWPMIPDDPEEFDQCLINTSRSLGFLH